MSKGLEALLTKYKESIQLASVERPHTRISLGPLSLNLAVGHPEGVRAGRIVQIAGRFSSGKSTLAYDMIAQYHNATGKDVLHVDFERAFDEKYARAIGINMDKLHIVRADTTEQGLSIVEAVVRTGDIQLVTIDSIAAAKPASENEKDYDDAMKMASGASVVTRFCNRIVPLLDNYDTLLVVLNQMRMNFNTLSPEKEVPYGAKALGFHSSVIIQTVAISNGEQQSEIQATIRKNRVGPPRQVVKFVIEYGKGIDHAQDIINLAVQHDIVNKSGAWFTYKGIKAQGMEKAKIEFPIQELRDQIIERLA